MRPLCPGGDMHLLLVLFTTLILSQNLWAYTSLEVSKTNPAYVKAVLNKECGPVFDTFEKKFDLVLTKLPYVQSISKIEAKDWAESSKAADSINSEKLLFYSMASSVPKDFPLSLFRAQLTRHLCLPDVKPAPGSSPCLASYTVDVDGSKTLVYRRTIELSKRKNTWNSFNVNFSFTATTDNTCQAQITLTVKDSNYLWGLKHLLEGVDPGQVETQMFSSFVNWGVTALTKLEE